MKWMQFKTTESRGIVAEKTKCASLKGGVGGGDFETHTVAQV